MSCTHFWPSSQLPSLLILSLSHLLAHTHLFTDGKLVLLSVHTNVYSRSNFVDENRLAQCMALQYYGMYVCYSLCADTIFLGRCTQTIKWKVKKANKQKLKWKTANTRHVQCSYYVYDDDENDDNDDDDNLNIVYVCWVFFKWNYRVGLLTSKICAHSCMQDHISFPQTDNPMLKHKGNIFDTFVWVFICYTV